MLLPSTSSSPTPSISPAVKWSKIYSIFPHKLLKLHAALKDNAPTAHSIMFFVFLIFSLIFSFPFSFSFFLSFSHFPHFLTCSTSPPLAHILEVRLLVHARSSWSEKQIFNLSLFLPVWYYPLKWMFWFWHRFRRPSMRSFQSAKIISESIFTKKLFSIALAGGINEHHTESSPLNWKRQCNQPELFFFSRNFYVKSSTLVCRLSFFFHFGVENREEQQKHPIAFRFNIWKFETEKRMGVQDIEHGLNLERGQV